MCYKDEVQRNAAIKLEEKIKDMPEFIQNYFVFLKSNKSKLNYWSAIRLLFEWMINQNIINNALENITPEDLSKVTDVHMIKYLDGLKSGLYGSKISATTVDNKKNMFSGFWNYLVDKDCVRKNIITKSVSNKYSVENKHEVTVATDKQIETFLSNLEGIKNEVIAIRDIAIVKLFMGSGIRIEELVGLDVKDLHFDNPEERYVMVMEKGEQDELVQVLINQSAYDALDTYLKVRNANPNNIDRKYLFVSENGGRLAQSSIQDFFREYSKGKIHPHMLRHGVGTAIYKNSNSNIGMVQKQLRHKDVNTSMKYYVKEDKKETSAVLNTF